jgi:hypothetical protein
MSGGLGLEALSVEEQRAVMEASTSMFPVDADVVVTEVDAGGVPADWLSIEACSEAGRLKRECLYQTIGLRLNNHSLRLLRML